MMRIKISFAILLLVQIQVNIAQVPVDISGKFTLENEQVRFEFEPVCYPKELIL